MLNGFRVCVAVAVLLFASPAHAERFTSAYHPQAGERAEITIDKCRRTNRNGTQAETCGRSVYIEEVLSVTPTGARMRYTIQSIEPVGDRGTALSADVQRTLQNFSMIVSTDAAGFPTQLENMSELMARVRSLVQWEDAAAQRVFDTMFEHMDPAGAAQLFTRDWAGMSLFQAVELETGRPITGQMSMPFPVDPSLTILANATLSLNSIDREVGRAHMTYTQVLDEPSAQPVIQAFVERVLAAAGADQPPDLAEHLARMRLARTDEWRAVVDTQSGRVVEMTSTTETRIDVAGENRRSSETITLTRRMLPST